MDKIDSETVVRKADELKNKAADIMEQQMNKWLPGNPSKDLLRGLNQAIVGFQSSISNKKIQSVYFEWAKHMLKILVPLYALAIAIIVFLAPLVALFPGIALQLLALVPFWATYFSKKIPKLGNQLFFIELEAKNPKLYQELKRMGTDKSQEKKLSWTQETSDDLRSSWHFSKYSLALSAVSIIPVLGPILAFAGQTLLVSDKMGYKLLSVYTQDCCGMRYKEEKKWMRERKFPVLGFSLPYTLLMSVPFAGPFLGGIAQAAAADLFDKVLMKEGNLSQSRME
eukprot:TRINITY_DN6421_c0_g1_i1.p1 TRINITY_DN6421_c0_g1~~TRINITY_DN6421_c0_g1_i1.p1  ORF type:complete len:283 (+),score=93.21 TRINITY_DN6421_c0_g1_i1:841-1689(+)